MKRCLIVDDSSVIRRVASHILASMRYEIFEAETAQEAIERCRTHPPDVVLLDWLLPGMTAIEFLATLRLSYTGRRPLIVYCTTENDPAEISRALGAGADDYLLKPFDRADIVTKFAGLDQAA